MSPVKKRLLGQPSSKRGGNKLACVARKRGHACTNAHDAVASLASQHPSSASRPSSNRIGWRPPRLSVTRSPSASSWTLQRCCGNAGSPVLSRLRAWCRRVPVGSNQVRRLDSKLPGHHSGNPSAERLPPISAGQVSRSTAMGSCSRDDGNSNGGERHINRGDARSPVRGLSATQRAVQVDSGSSRSASPEIGHTQLGSLLGSSGGAENLESSRGRREHFAGRPALRCPWQGAGNIHGGRANFHTLVEPITGQVRSRLCQMGRSLRSESDHDSSVLYSPRRGVGGCSLEKPVLDRDSETRLRRYEKHARLLKETSKLHCATRDYGQLVIDRMSQFLGDALPPNPPEVKAKLQKCSTTEQGWSLLFASGNE